MTRAPRSRKKKSAKTIDPTLVATAASSESLDLPLPAADMAADELAINAAPMDVTNGTESVEMVQVAMPAELLVDADTGDVEPILQVAERSTLRVDVTEDRSHLGPRLRAAREVRGWSREDVAHRLHVPTTIVADIEAERFERLGAPIYLRGYLSKYAQLVDLPMVVVNRVLEGMSEPTLKASTETPRVAATWERYRVAVIGGVITLAVAIPVLTLVANRGINAPVPQVRSLDESELVESALPAPSLPTTIAAQDLATSTIDVGSGSGSGLEFKSESASVDTLTATTPAPVNVASQEPSLMASMTGFSTPVTTGMHVLEARFREDSWIEIFDADGHVIEQNLVRAGQSRRYESTGAVSIKIGNVSGVDVQADGNLIDLAAHARANVARLRLFEESAATPTP
ncbi:MAG: DUF4115 domain-containing protein [Rhodanobacteraceae bacterium]|nr:DUF4115 domain-containing protein [Rhodanobacteraceae bacterium]MBP9154802.1 DUF4115 domain-containing protein [Xanthomonadales bacterium]